MEDLTKDLPKIDEFLVNKKEELSEGVGEVVGDLFYKSMKDFFEFGFKLAEDLSNEYSKE
jgi:hypothetical protein